MFPLRTLDDTVLARLDAKGTDAFHLNNDRIPAYNSAQRIVQGAINSLMQAKKFSAEQLRDLNQDAVFQTSTVNTIEIDRILQTTIVNYVPQKVWTVLAVHPEFVSYPSAPVITPDTVALRSILRPDVRFIRPIESAKMYTQENAGKASKNPFMPGNTAGIGKKDNGYGFFFGSEPTTTVGPGPAVVLTLMGLPEGVRHLVAVSYLKVPLEIRQMPLLENDPLYNQTFLEWPDSMIELLVAVSLRMLSYPIGDGTTLNALSTQEMSMLLNAVT